MNVFYKQQLSTLLGLILFFVFIIEKSYSQTIIEQQDFEATPATPTMSYTNTGGNVGLVTPGVPAGATTASEGSRGLYLNKGTFSFTSGNIDTRCYLSPSVTFRLAALGNNTASGMDGNDNVTVAISIDGGTTWTNELIVKGVSNANAHWGYTTGTGVASSTYDGNGTVEASKTFAPSAGGSRTTDGYSTVTLSSLPNVQNLRIRITLVNQRNNETWAMDKVVLSSANTQYSNPTSTPVSSGNSRCETGTVTLSATGAGTGESYNWYAASTGGTILMTNANYTTPSLTTTTSYYVTTCNSTVPTCESTASRVISTATINTLTTAPTSISSTSNLICSGTPITLTQTGGILGNSSSWKWYSNATYTTLVGTSSAAGADLTISPSTTTTYYLRAEGQNSTCTVNAPDSISVTVNQPSVAPTTLNVSTATICNGSSTTLTQTGGTLGTGASWKWYSNASFTTLVGTSVAANASLSVNPSTTTTYYLRAEGTTSPCTVTVAASGSVTVTVNQPSVAPTSLNVSTATICNGSSTTLTQTGGTLGTGASWKWYSDAAFTTLVGTSVAANASLSVNPSTTTTYYLRAEGTTSPCTATLAAAGSVTVTVNQPSVTPTTLNVSTTTICNGSSTTLTQTGGTLGTGASWKWYSDATFTSLVGTSAVANASLSVSPTTTTTYYLRAEGTSSPCTATVAASGSVTVTVNQPSVAPTSLNVSTATICNGSSTTLTQTGGTLGTGASWKWYSDAAFTTLVGTSAVANASLSVSPTTTTTYYLRAEGTTSPCTATLAAAGSVTVTIQEAPTVIPSSISAFVDDYITVPAGVASNGTYSWTHNGTGYFDQTYFPVGNQLTATPTYYVETGDFGKTVTLTVTVTGLCSSVSATNTYTINVDGRPGIYRYQCGTTVPYMDEYIYAYAYPGATMYRYRITSDGGATYQTLDKNNTVFYMRLFPAAKYSTTYAVDVAAFVGGAWTAYGASCNITTPAIPNTAVIASQRGTTLAAINTTIFADWVFGVTQYEFSLLDGSSTQTFQTSNNYLKLTDLASYAYSKTYAIKVRVLYNGVWQPWGSTYNVSSPSFLSKLISTQCGITLTDMATDLYADNVIGATAYRFRLTEGSNVLTIDKVSRTFKPSQVANIKYGTTYVVDVAAYLNGAWQSYAATCNITTPSLSSTQLISSQRNITLTNIATDLYADSYLGATAYRFRVTNGAIVQTIDKPSRTFKLTHLASVFYGTTLSIDVDTQVNGVWIGYGTAYNVTTPSLPNTKIQTSQCGTTLGSTTDMIYADAVPGVSQYRFRIINAELAYSQTKDKVSNVFRFSELTGLTLKTTYSVDVAVYYNGAWQSYGTTCSITTPGVLAMQTLDEGITAEQVNPNQESESIQDKNETLSIQTKDLDTQIEVFPNPSNDWFTISKLQNGTSIKVFDATGKTVSIFEKTNSNQLKFGNELNKGIYFIEIEQLNNKHFFKIVKE